MSQMQNADALVISMTGDGLRQHVARRYEQLQVTYTAHILYNMYTVTSIATVTDRRCLSRHDHWQRKTA